MKHRIILLLALLASLTQSGWAAVIIEASPAAQVKVLGNQATVDIVASGGYVGAFDLDISWNSGIVSLFSISYGTQLGLSIQNPFAYGAGTVNASEFSLETPADLVALQPGQTATLLTLVFDTIAVGTSPVNISYNAIGDEYGIAHNPVTLNPGSITVRKGGPAEVPEPASTVMVGLGGGLLALGLRKSKLRRAGN
jgi:hypothetical protein